MGGCDGGGGVMSSWSSSGVRFPRLPPSGPSPSELRLRSCGEPRLTSAPGTAEGAVAAGVEEENLQF